MGKMIIWSGGGKSGSGGESTLSDGPFHMIRLNEKSRTFQDRGGRRHNTEVPNSQSGSSSECVSYEKHRNDLVGS